LKRIVTKAALSENIAKVMLGAGNGEFDEMILIDEVEAEYADAVEASDEYNSKAMLYDPSVY
jgi:hypothetical protein